MFPSVVGCIFTRPVEGQGSCISSLQRCLGKKLCSYWWCSVLFFPLRTKWSRNAVLISKGVRTKRKRGCWKLTLCLFGWSKTKMRQTGKWRGICSAAGTEVKHGFTWQADINREPTVNVCHLISTLIWFGWIWICGCLRSWTLPLKFQRSCGSIPYKR